MDSRTGKKGPASKLLAPKTDQILDLTENNQENPATALIYCFKFVLSATSQGIYAGSKTLPSLLALGKSFGRR